MGIALGAQDIAVNKTDNDPVLMTVNRQQKCQKYVYPILGDGKCYGGRLKETRNVGQMKGM